MNLLQRSHPTKVITILLHRKLDIRLRSILVYVQGDGVQTKWVRQKTKYLLRLHFISFENCGYVIFKGDEKEERNDLPDSDKFVTQNDYVSAIFNSSGRKPDITEQSRV